MSPPSYRPPSDALTIGPLFVGSAFKTPTFSQGTPTGVVNTTVSNQPYAPVTNVADTLASPFPASTSCSCGQPNPDGCVGAHQTTDQYLEFPLSKKERYASYNQSPALSISPVEAYLALRAAPMAAAQK